MRRVQGRDGRRGRPGRGLSLDRIVTATLELVDEESIGAATMREVSSRLGVRSMSLYRYVRDRDELLDAVVERIRSTRARRRGREVVAAMIKIQHVVLEIGKQRATTWFPLPHVL